MARRLLFLFTADALRLGAPEAVDARFGSPIVSNAYDGVEEEALASPYSGIDVLIDEDSREAFRTRLLPRLRSGPTRVSLYSLDHDESISSLTSSINTISSNDWLVTGPLTLFPPECLNESTIIICEQEAVARFGGLFFWRTLYNKECFLSANDQLFRAEYLPTQLAKEGHGLFFEERIEQRLKSLGLIAEDVDVRAIKDGGGWATLDELTASVSVTFLNDGVTRTAELLATALIPYPPVTPTALCALIEARRRFLSSLGIRSNVLLAERGVVFHRGLLSIASALRDTAEPARARILEQAADIAAVVDANFFGREMPAVEILDFGPIHNYEEISAPTDVGAHLDFLDILRVDPEDKTVFWADFQRNPRDFYRCSESSWGILSRILSNSEQTSLYHLYKLRGVAPMPLLV